MSKVEEKESVFESYRWKQITGIFYSGGAALVILGALFKIMHWPFGGLILSVGMLIEVVIFFLGVFDKPFKTYDWSKVFPQFDSNSGAEQLAFAGSIGGLGAVAANNNVSLPTLETPPISEEDIERLSGSIKKLTDTAGQLASFSSASTITESYIKNVSAASDAVGAFSGSQRSLTESSAVLVDSFKGFATNMSAVSNDSKTFMEQVSALNVTLSSVNSTYELQLQSMSSQADTFSSVNASLEKITAVMDASVKEAEAYKEQTAKLTQQVSNLNNIYGNMLNAMNVRA